MRQQQFLEVVERDDAERRWRETLQLVPRGIEEVPLASALGRVLAENVIAHVDVPSFDRSNLDGFAIRAQDSFGADEERPIRLSLNGETIPTGVQPRVEVKPGTATSIATGGMMPRGADAVIAVEDTEVDETENCVLLHRAQIPGGAVSYAGTDMGAGETVLYAGTRITSREAGVLAAIGCHRVPVARRPKVVILSTGDEIIEPGATMRPGLVYDSNGRILIDAVRELGGDPEFAGIFRDRVEELRVALQSSLGRADLVLLSGGTSKGGEISTTRWSENSIPGSSCTGWP